MVYDFITTNTETYEIRIHVKSLLEKNELSSYVSAISDKSSFPLSVDYDPKVDVDGKNAIKELGKKVVENHVYYYLKTQGIKEAEINLAYEFPQDKKVTTNRFTKGRSFGLNENQQNLFEACVDQAYKDLLTESKQ